MKLEDQVCSLELAKKLKELGVKQESLFSWVKYKKAIRIQTMSCSRQFCNKLLIWRIRNA